MSSDASKKNQEHYLPPEKKSRKNQMSDSKESDFDSSIFDASDGHKLVELIRKKKGLHVKSQKIFDDVPSRRPSLHIEFRRLDEEKSSSKEQPAQQEENIAPVENEPTVSQPAANKPPSKFKRSNVLPELTNVVPKSPRRLSAATIVSSPIIKINSTSLRRRALREEFEKAFLSESRFVPQICSTPQITQIQKPATSESPALENTIVSPITISDADTPDIATQTTTNTENLMRSLIEQENFLNELNLESNVQPEETISNKSPTRTFTVERDIATGRITLTPNKSRKKTEIKTASQTFRSPLKLQQATKRKIVATPEQRKVLLSRLGIDLAAARYNGSRVENIPRQSTPKKTSNTIAVVNDNQEPTGTAELVECLQTNSRSNYPVVVNLTLNQAPAPVRETTPLTTPTKHYQKAHHPSPDKISTINLENPPKTPNKKGAHDEELTWNDIITDDESSSEANKSPNRTKQKLSLSHKCLDLRTRKTSTPRKKNLSQRSRCERLCTDKSLQHRAEREEEEQQDNMQINTRPSSRRGTYTVHQQNVSPARFQRRETFTVNRDNAPQTQSHQLESVIRDEEVQTDEQGIEPPSPHENVNSDETAEMQTRKQANNKDEHNSPSTHHRRTHTKSTNVLPKLIRNSSSRAIESRRGDMSKFDEQLGLIREPIQATNIDLVSSSQTPIIQPPPEFWDCTSNTDADLAGELSSDRVLLSQSKFKIPAAVGKQKQKKRISKLPKNVEEYLKTSQKLRRNNYLNVSKRKLYSKGGSDLDSVSGDSFEVQTTQSSTRTSSKSLERAATRDAMKRQQLVVKVSRDSFKRANAKNCCESTADKSTSRESRSRQRKPQRSFSSSSSDKEYSTDASKKLTGRSKNKRTHENNSKSVNKISQNLKLSMQQNRENSKTKHYSRLRKPAESSSDSLSETSVDPPPPTKSRPKKDKKKEKNRELKEGSDVTVHNDQQRKSEINRPRRSKRKSAESSSDSLSDNNRKSKNSNPAAAKKVARKVFTAQKDVPETTPISHLSIEVHNRPDDSSLDRNKTNSKATKNLKSAAARKKRSKIIADQNDVVKNTSYGRLSRVIRCRSGYSSSDESEKNSNSKSAAGQKESSKISTAQMDFVEKTSIGHLSLVTRDTSDKSEIIEQSNTPRSQSKSQSSDNILTQTNRGRMANTNVAATNAMEKETAVDPPPPAKSRPKKDKKKETNRELKEAIDVTVQQESEINGPRRSKRKSAESSSDSLSDNNKKSKNSNPAAAKKVARKVLTAQKDVPETTPVSHLSIEVHNRPDDSSLDKNKTNSKATKNLKSAAARKKRSKIIADQNDVVKNTSYGRLSRVIRCRSGYSSSDESEKNSNSKSAAGQNESSKISTAQMDVVEKTSIGQLPLVTRDTSDKSEIIEQSNTPRSQSKSQSSDNILTQTNRGRMTNTNVATTNAMEKETAVDPPPPAKSRPKKYKKKEKNRELKEAMDVQEQESENNGPRRSKRERRQPGAYWAPPNSGFTHAYDIVAMLTKGKNLAQLFEKDAQQDKKKKKNTKSPPLSKPDDNLVANTKVIDSSSSKKKGQQKSKKQKSKQIAGDHESEQTQKSDLTTKVSNSENQILSSVILSDLSSSVQPLPKITEEQNELDASCSEISTPSSGNIDTHRKSNILMPPPKTNVIIKPVRKKKQGNKYQTEHDKSIADVSSDHVNKLFDQLKNSSISVQHCSGLEMINSSGQVTLDNRCITHKYPSSSPSSSEMSAKRSTRSSMQRLNLHSEQTSQSRCLDSGFSSEDTNLVNPPRDILLDWLMQIIKNGKSTSNNQKGLARVLRTTNNHAVAYADQLTFEEIDGVEFAFYDTPGRKFGYLRFKPHTEKKMSCAKRHELHFILLGGTIQMTVDNECFDMKNGDLTTIFIGTRYRMKNITDDPALAMVIKS